ncbi:hemerythrin domain-containing protein [Actinomadura fulvescens]|uniref:Hemerythrin-like domain-containing protein n=1 Tax=Actinomadura fulvescens TaxID=46160 RepID=A0ABN3QWT8_9ACTN
MSGKLDMTPMYAMHDALPRELEHIARIAGSAGSTGDPARILRTAAGWRMFKTSLHVHHTTEDDALWPVMRQALADQPDELALLAEMEEEHAAIDPLIHSIDAALAGEEPVGDLLDSLVTRLRAHLEHEEREALPLIDATVTEKQWRHFGQVHGSRIGPDAPRLVPWLLDGASAETVTAMLAPLPEPARSAFQNQWQPAYAALDRWGTTAP